MKTPARAAVPGHPIATPDLAGLRVDGLTPSTIMHPEDADDAARGLRQCAEAGAGVVVWGGGTLLTLGAVPRRYDVAFSTDRLTHVLEYEPADLTCRVQAGVPVAALQDQLGKHGQWLPLAPPHPERATLGGTVAANASGPGRARYGSVRDWVIGITVAYPNGKVARAGGKVVKNVAGYDLMKLHTGALGTLGVVVEVNLKVQARPQASRSLWAHFERVGDAVACALALSRGYLQPAVMAAITGEAVVGASLPRASGVTLAMRVEGHQAEVDATVAAIASAVSANSGRLEADGVPDGVFEAVRDWTAPESPATIVFTASVPRTGVLTVVEAAGRDAGVVALPAVGTVHVRPRAEEAAEMLPRLRRAAGADGQVVVASAPPAFKTEVDVWGPPPAGFALMRALKDRLDPLGTLNPGRFVGGI
ncbi:MAG TPA: FAD-binding oxidoreductase [Candidatus Limnocylindrales bacterium]|nr:FAD-binding oxidoreductase [Candidatus Limnocylindrales bacterium]